MKQMNVRAEAALLEVARRHHTTVEEVRREIRLAMAMAMCNPAPATRKIWGEIPCDGNVLTPEDLITYAAMPGRGVLKVSCPFHGSRRCYFIFISIFCVSCIGVSMG